MRSWWLCMESNGAKNCYPTAGEGNVFTHVCLSTGVYDVTSCLAAWYHVPSRGCVVLTEVWSLGSLNGSPKDHTSQRDHPPVK